MNAKNYWPTGIIAAFVLFIAGTIALVIVASRGTADLVSADYYEQEVRYQKRMESLERASQLARPAGVEYDAARKNIVISLPHEHVASASGMIQLYRPSASALDRRIEIKTDQSGLQIIDSSPLAAGSWKVVIIWTANGLEYCVNRRIVIDRS